MKVYRYIYSGWLAALLMGWGCLMTDCTDHQEIEVVRPDVPDEQPLGIHALTRADGDTDPMKNVSVKLFLLPNGSTTDTGGEVTYTGKDDGSSEFVFGTSALYVKPGTDYRVFGFMPASAATGTSSVTMNEETAVATMTVNGLPAISTQDISVVVGVKGGKLTALEPTVTLGQFAYHAPENTVDGYGVSLLRDHLYAGVTFNFSISVTYNALRTIKLKKVVMKSASQKVNASIPFKTDDVGIHPIRTAPTTTDAGTQDEVILYQSENTTGEALTVKTANTPLACSGYFWPGIEAGLTIESTYDVYDKNNHLIRENCKAVNGLSIVLGGLNRGERKVVSLTVDPTYLYVLSDWDNPGFVVN